MSLEKDSEDSIVRLRDELRDLVIKFRLNQGVELLDKLYPSSEWPWDLDLEKLDLSNTKTCMAGQLNPSSSETFDDYTRLLASWGVRPSEDFKYGLNIQNAGLYIQKPTDGITYRMLTAAWIERITQLRQERPRV